MGDCVYLCALQNDRMNVQSKTRGAVAEEISAKKKAIFESTLQLVREHGFHGTPMSLVAKTANVAAGTIYHYFDGKDELIRELYRYNRLRLIDVVDRAVMRGGEDRAKFYRICGALYEFYLNHPDVLVFFEQFLNSPYRDSVPETTFESRPLQNYFSEGVQRGHFKPIRVELFISIVMCTVASCAKMKLGSKLEIGGSDIDQVIGVLWDGCVRTGGKGDRTGHDD